MYLEHQQKDMSETKLIHIAIDKVWGINVSNLCVLLKYLFYETETIRSRLSVIFYIGYWNFENNRSINRLFSESTQH